MPPSPPANHPRAPLRPVIWAGRRIAIGRKLDPRRRLDLDTLNAWIDDKVRRDVETLERQRDGASPRKAERLAVQIAELKQLLAEPGTKGRR